MNLESVIQKLYDSEINCLISSFWQCGFTVKIGDDMNGFAAETEVETVQEATDWLDAKARELYPNSAYVIGVDECRRRFEQSQQK